MIGYSLVLPLSPSVNHYYQRNKGGGVRVSDRGQAFRKEVWAAVKQSKMPTLSGRLCVVLRVYPRDRKTVDIDNFAKAVLDALQIAGAFVNDSQVDELTLTRGSVINGGRIEALIGEIEP